jgi:hypothetical protein
LERNRLLAGNIHWARWSVNAQRAVEHREPGLRPVQLQANVARWRQLQLLLAEEKVELVAS